MKALDLFCGLGGWSDGLAIEGFEILGVEIEPRIAELYKHPVIIADVRDLDPKDFKGYDLIVGSPPCRDFCLIAETLGHRWNDPPDPEGRGMELVNAFLNFVEKAEPTYWLMENSPFARKYIETPARQHTRLGRGMPRCFWGNYPSFLVPRDFSKTISSSNKRLEPLKGVSKFMEPFVRAKIPLPTAKALGKAVRLSINSKSRRIEVDENGV